MLVRTKLELKFYLSLSLHRDPLKRTRRGYDFTLIIVTACSRSTSWKHRHFINCHHEGQVVLLLCRIFDSAICKTLFLVQPLSSSVGSHFQANMRRGIKCDWARRSAPILLDYHVRSHL